MTKHRFALISVYNALYSCSQPQSLSIAPKNMITFHSSLIKLKKLCSIKKRPASSAPHKEIVIEEVREQICILFFDGAA